VVLGAFLGGAAEFFTPKARAIGHALFWGLNLGLFAVAALYLYTQTPKVRAAEPLALKWGPFICVVLGAFLVMLDLTRHCLLDLGLAGEELAMYTDDGDLSTVGMTGVTCTWIGVVLISIGFSWWVNLPNKIAKQWEALTQTPVHDKV